MKKIDISSKELLIIKNILKKYLPSSVSIWVFGSRAKGTARKFSDLDLAIDIEKPIDKQLLANMIFDFEESDLPYKVDILDWQTLNQDFKNLIKKDRISLNIFKD